ncbi:hypothetical protein MP638_005361 [Amoeboaphelidium occidentale]|nr:hypothetical protein MP638_005361 [Amoeboaphelidium occidentale]
MLSVSVAISKGTIVLLLLVVASKYSIESLRAFAPFLVLATILWFCLRFFTKSIWTESVNLGIALREILLISALFLCIQSLIKEKLLFCVSNHLHCSGFLVLILVLVDSIYFYSFVLFYKLHVVSMVMFGLTIIGFVVVLENRKKEPEKQDSALRSQSLEQEFGCPLCFEYVAYPCAVECGHVYCASCLTDIIDN